VTDVQFETYQLSIHENYQSAVHRFRTPGSRIPILLIHGSIENARIFFSRSLKGFAPYLARNGFDVFAPDLAGKGESIPRISRQLKHSQNDFIDRDMPAYIEEIRRHYPSEKIRFSGHSWGGVLLLAWYARHGKPEDTGPMVFFGTKRRIATRSLKRFFMIDLMWNGLGRINSTIFGYLPAKTLRMGSDNEPYHFYRDANAWVYQKTWIDRHRKEHIGKLLQHKKPPPILYFSAINDDVLGNPSDVQRLISETHADNAKHILLSKANGNRKDYDHINMLTASEGPEDHFIQARDWLQSE
jgi:predicted alpha/beta hydrolase